jgi:hypothetical protein
MPPPRPARPVVGLRLLSPLRHVLCTRASRGRHGSTVRIISDPYAEPGVRSRWRFGHGPYAATARTLGRGDTGSL